MEIIGKNGGESKHKRMSRVVLPRALKSELQCFEGNSFYFDSSDQYIKRILLGEGWKAMQIDTVSRLRWVYQPKNNTFSELPANSMINHFPHSHFLTTKLGLCKTLRGERAAITQSSGRCHTAFYPRSYDLGVDNESFVRDFKQTAILNLLKKMMIAVELADELLFQKMREQALRREQIPKQINWVQQFKLLFQKQQLFQPTIGPSKQLVVNSEIFQSLLYYFSLMFTLDYQLSETSINKQEINKLVAYSLLNPPYHSFQQHYNCNRILAKSPTNKCLRLFFGLYSRALQRFAGFRSDGLRNIWVVKASDSSRGRNIALISSLQQLKVSNFGNKLVQKYIQDTWIVRESRQHMLNKYQFLKKLQGKKFDIRIWVLVTSFNPVKAYVYKEGYLRISQEQYQLHNLERERIHLTNFSVNWKQTEINPQGSYVMFSEFVDYLDREKIKSKLTLMNEINSIIRQTLQATEVRVGAADKRCFELYGFDVILDSQLKPWLLEVNMSPACTERGRLTAEVEKMGRGLLGLLGLIESNNDEKGWDLINFGQREPLRIRKFQKQNVGVMAKSECVIRPLMKKVQTLRVIEQKQLLLTRVTSLLPAIGSTHSGHIKSQLAVQPGNSVNLIVAGNGLCGRKLQLADRFVNMVEAALTISKLYQRIRKNRRNSSKMRNGNEQTELVSKCPFSWLRLFECVNIQVKKVKGKAFKKIANFVRKRNKSKLRISKARLI